jgi:radical SAM superfamily enzyme YgiQ (UPF0313 family)
MEQYRKIILLKVPYCTHPEGEVTDQNFRTRTPFRPIPSIALASLCAFIKKHGSIDYILKAIDVNIEAYDEPKEPVDTSVYSELLEESIKNNEYDVLALSVMFVYNEKWLRDAVCLSRKYHKNSKIIVGGGYPTIFPERCLKDNDVDDVVIGEGESTLLHILNRYNRLEDKEFVSKYPLESYMSRDEDTGVVISNERTGYIPLEELPSPAWEYLDIEKYIKNSGDRSLPVEGSRGCPYRCSFCCSNITWGRKVRYKPVENLLSEIKKISEKFSLNTLSFVDDNLSMSKKWIIEFFTRLIDLKLPVKCGASNFSVLHLDEEIIDLMKTAGMKGFGIAVETGSLEMQKVVKKNLDFDLVRKIVGIMKEKDMEIHICWMIGFPGETMSQIKSTFDFARELRAHSNQFLTVLPYPGTQLFDEAKAAGLLFFEDSDLDKYDNRKCDYIKSSEWNYEALQKMIYAANIEINFLKNTYLDNPNGFDKMKVLMERVIARLPQHIIALIILGYISKKRDDLEKRDELYNRAMSLFENKTLNETFSVYLSSDDPIINDFNEYREKTYEKA